MYEESYYNVWEKIDQSDRTRKYYFRLEWKSETTKWHIRVNHSILGMNKMIEYKAGMACGFWDEKNPHDFHYNLVEDIIDNKYKINGPMTR